MRKHRKPAVLGFPAGDPPPVLTGDPAYGDPQDAIDQELLGIWMSISRLRQIIRNRPPAAPGGRVVAWRRPAAAPKKCTLKKSTSRKPRRKAA